MKPLFVLLFALLPVSMFGQDVKAWCEKTDAALSARNLAEAKKAIEEAYKLAPKDYDVLCRYSRVLALFGDEQKESEQEKIYLRALELADEAVSLNSGHALGYVRRAAARGKVALFKGVLSVADMVKATRDDAEKAIKLQNDGEQTLASAHYILGRAHLKLAEQPKVIRKPLGLDWGNLDDAVQHLKKATELRNGYIMFHLDYARALVKKKQIDEAKRELTAISQMQPTEFGDEARKQEAFSLLSELK
ncbi:MAG: tetratricopeptide repeat protein [Chloroherpetonaceae bacterium]